MDMEVLVTFESAMESHGNSYIQFPDVMGMDDAFADKVNEIGKKSAFVIYNIYLSDVPTDVVSFINNSFRGSFAFIHSDVLNRWCLITPFSKDSWRSEYLIVTDAQVKNALIEHSNNESESNIKAIVSCVQPKDIQ